MPFALFRRHKRYAWLGCLAICFAAEGESAEIHDDANGYTVTTPAFGEPPDGSVTQLWLVAGPAENGFAPYVNLQLQRFTIERNAFVKQSEEQFAAGKMKLLSKTLRDVNGLPAVVFEVEWTLDEVQLHLLSLAVFQKDRVLLLTCTAPAASFAKHEPEFKKTIESFKPTN